MRKFEQEIFRISFLLFIAFHAGAANSPVDDDGQWVMPGKTYANTRFSSLDQINTQNAKNLKVAWTFSTGVNRGQEATPIVVSNTMYVITPFPNILYALD